MCSSDLYCDKKTCIVSVCATSVQSDLAKVRAIQLSGRNKSVGVFSSVNNILLRMRAGLELNVHNDHLSPVAMGLTWLT